MKLFSRITGEDIDFVLNFLQERQCNKFEFVDTFTGTMGEFKTIHAFEEEKIHCKHIGALEEYENDDGDILFLDTLKTLDIKTTCKYMNPRKLYTKVDQVYRDIDAFAQATIHWPTMTYTLKYGIRTEKILANIEKYRTLGDKIIIPIEDCESINNLIRFLAVKESRQPILV